MSIVDGVLLAWILADFMSGVGHWIEDRYLVPDDSWIGRNIAAPNLLHHDRPSAFLAGGYWYRNWTTILLAAVGSLLALLAASPWWVHLSMLFVSQANELHAWAHQRCSGIVRALQDTGIIQSARHHGWHHHAPYDVHYCILSEWLNPVLDYFGFWLAMERGLSYLGIHTKEARGL